MYSSVPFCVDYIKKSLQYDDPPEMASLPFSISNLTFTIEFYKCLLSTNIYFVLSLSVILYIEI